MIRQAAAIVALGIIATVAFVLIVVGATATIAATGTVGDTAATVGGAPLGNPNEAVQRPVRLDTEGGWHQETRTIRLLTATETNEGLTVRTVDRTLEGQTFVNDDTTLNGIVHHGGAVVEHRLGPPSAVSFQTSYDSDTRVIVPVTLYRDGSDREAAGGQWRQSRAVTQQLQSTHLAIETSAHERWRPYFEAANMTVVASELRFPGDTESSVVVALPPDREVTLVIHEVAIGQGRHG